MSLENPTVDDLKNLIQAELACILGEVGTTVGTEIGNLQKQVDLLTGTDTAALLELQTQITNLTTMLDGDADTPGMQNLTNLLALIDRVAALETWQSTAADQISQFVSTFASIESRIAAVEQGGAGGNTCDCAQIATDIQGLRDQIVTLQGVDAAQAQQLQTLTTRLNGLETVLEGLSDQLAGLATAIATAGGNADAALTAANAAQNAVNTLRDREDARHTEHGNAIGMIRNQIYGQFVGLCDAVKPGFGSAFAAAKAAAIAA
jgi:chromosome segregation ATPase